MHWAAGLSAVIAALGIIVVLRWMPGQEDTSVAPVGAGRRARAGRHGIGSGRMSDMTSTADAPRSPGRPRSVRADEAIIEATLDLLAEGSTIEALSIEAIAARAGVGKATIYRRWAGKDALLLDALRRLKGVLAQPAGHSVRDDLVLLVGAIGKNVDPRAAKIMPCLVPAVNRSADQFQLYQNIIAPRRQLMREVLRRGIARACCAPTSTSR